MTLRRCDSLPTQLREAERKRAPDPGTAAEEPQRDQVIATWKSLQTDVRKIKNGLPPRNDHKRPDKRGSIKHRSVPFECSNGNGRKRIAYDNRHVVVRQQDDRGSSFPMEPARAGSSEGRRRTLLQRLLPWKRGQCDCRERYMPKSRPEPTLRPEDLLCTCGASAARYRPRRSRRFTERGRSKSVGYEVAKEVTQFRRCASAGASVGAETAAALRARAALTLARRYYPEGGWGWTVTVVGTLVQVLVNGLQLGGGTGAIACTAAHKFRVPPLYTHGE